MEVQKTPEEQDKRLKSITKQLQRFKELEILNQTKNACQNFNIDFKLGKRRMISSLLGDELTNNFSDEDVLEFTSCYFDSKIINNY